MLDAERASDIATQALNREQIRQSMLARYGIPDTGPGTIGGANAGSGLPFDSNMTPPGIPETQDTMQQTGGAQPAKLGNGAEQAGQGAPVNPNMAPPSLPSVGPPPKMAAPMAAWTKGAVAQGAGQQGPGLPQMPSGGVSPADQALMMYRTQLGAMDASRASLAQAFQGNQGMAMAPHEWDAQFHAMNPQYTDADLQALKTGNVTPELMAKVNAVPVQIPHMRMGTETFEGQQASSIRQEQALYGRGATQPGLFQQQPAMPQSFPQLRDIYGGSGAGMMQQYRMGQLKPEDEQGLQQLDLISKGDVGALGNVIVAPEVAGTHKAAMALRVLSNQLQDTGWDPSSGQIPEQLKQMIAGNPYGAEAMKEFGSIIMMPKYTPMMSTSGFMRNPMLGGMGQQAPTGGPMSAADQFGGGMQSTDQQQPPQEEQGAAAKAAGMSNLGPKTGGKKSPQGNPGIVPPIQNMLDRISLTDPQRAVIQKHLAAGESDALIYQRAQEQGFDLKGAVKAAWQASNGKPKR